MSSAAISAGVAGRPMPNVAGSFGDRFLRRRFCSRRFRPWPAGARGRRRLRLRDEGHHAEGADGHEHKRAFHVHDSARYTTVPSGRMSQPVIGFV